MGRLSNFFPDSRSLPANWWGSNLCFQARHCERSSSVIASNSEAIYVPRLLRRFAPRNDKKKPPRNDKKKPPRNDKKLLLRMTINLLVGL